LPNQLHDIPELAALRTGGHIVRIPPEMDVPITPRVRQLIDTPEFHRPGLLVVDVAHVLAPACARTPYLEQMWARAAAAARRILPVALKLDELDRRAFALAQAFSFVGDAGFDPEDAVYAGFFDPDDVKGAAPDGAPKPVRRFVEW